MKLSPAERLILSNQYQILAMLEPDGANRFDVAREAVESGYAGSYDELFHYIDDELPEDECEVVQKILAMFRHLKDSYGKLKVKPDIEDWRIAFSGFDGNSETQQMLYARFIINRQGGFQEFIPDARDNFNSHMPTLDRYRRMLREWDSSKSIYNLTSEDIVRIANA